MPRSGAFRSWETEYVKVSSSRFFAASSAVRSSTRCSSSALSETTSCSARLRSVMSMPTPSKHSTSLNTMRMPVKKYGISRPSFVAKPASTEDSPSLNTRAMRSATRSLSPGAMKSSGRMPAISSAE